LSAGTDYTISFTGSSLTITPRGLSVSADPQTKVYGASDPALTYAHGALYNGDTDGDFSGGLVRASGEHVAGSPDAITQGSLSAGTDYTISFTGADLTITPRVLHVSATGVNKTYDGTTAATVALSDDRVSGDVFTDSYASATFDTKNVGTGKAVSVSGISI